MSPSGTQSTILSLVGPSGVKVLERLFDRVSTSVNARLEAHDVKKQAESAHRHFNRLLNVKTILSRHKAISINDFYYPVEISFPGRAPFEPEHLGALLPEHPHVLIQGSAGQGKSIYLRRLAALELTDAQRVPLFVELRGLQSKDSLQSRFETALEEMGFSNPPQAYRLLLEQSLFTVFLDGFDEVGRDARASVAGQIQALIRQHPAQRLVVSSRPGTAIDNLPELAVATICPITSARLPELLQRISGDADECARLMPAIKQWQYQDLRSAIRTPLLAALLVLKFRQHHTVPDAIPAFFDSVLPLLVKEHPDLARPFLMERRSSGLPLHELTRVVDTLAYLCKARSVSEGDRGVTGIGTIEKALRLASISADPQRVQDDLLNEVGILVEDDGYLVFLHESIRDYHAARWIAQSLPNTKNKVYQKLLVEWSLWLTCLGFLSAIDRYAFDTMFFLKVARRFDPSSAVHTPARFFGDDRAFVESGTRHLTRMCFESDFSSSYCAMDLREDIRDAVAACILQLPEEDSATLTAQSTIFVKDLLACGAPCVKELRTACERAIDVFLRRLAAEEKYVAELPQLEQELSI